MDLSQTPAPPPVPSHVPNDLVRHSYPMSLGTVTAENPYETIIPALHRDYPPVFYSTNGYPGGQPMWVFQRRKDQTDIYQDTEHFSSKDFSPFAKLLGETWSPIPTEIDPPQHQYYRNLLNPLFSPKKMATLEASVRQFAQEAVAKIQAKGECDFMQDLAFQFPIQVFLELLGLPLDELPKFMRWELMMTHPRSLEEMTEGARLVRDFMVETIEQRSREPQDDFLTYVIHSELQGRKLTRDEMLGFGFLLFLAGLDTVSTHIGLLFRHLAEHPEHQNLLRAQPELIPLAVEEFLRAYAAVTTYRTCIKPISIGGVQLMPGDRAAMVTSLSGRDPEAFDNPGEVRLDRNPRHTTFASGPHRCIGAPLARRELTIAMEEFLKAIPEFRIKPGVELLTSIGPIIQPLSLPLVWES
ncbi:MAG: cytochrome [Hydrocarboniphaga sp.]|uniref:cytochrome P450 n=1 Tax=Hydrocarboniphaga sp. TaxID=2033016 RepID=UPI0026163BF8|nr:cytochrome P450 [Hydrocarboniphaga sp.]MDB5971410.1 cytochrome [Hydrocarboniphaga sp.]